MYSIERDYSCLVRINTKELKEAIKVSDNTNCNLYKNGKLIYEPNNKTRKEEYNNV